MIYTSETYKEYLQELLPKSNFELIDFQGAEKPCSIYCKNCNSNISFTLASNISRRARRDCRNVCANCEENVWKKKQKDAFNKAQYLLKKKESIELIGEVKSWGQKEKTEWRCLKCNHTFERSPSCMFQSMGKALNCPWCEAHPFEYSEEMIKEKVFEMWGTEFSFLSIDKIKNKNGSKRVLVKHNKCGFSYSVSLYNFLHGQGCPKCRKSHGGKKVRDYLNKHSFSFLEQKAIFTNNTCLKLDFYLEENNKKIAIEYNGIQHYKPVEYFGGEKEYLKQCERDKWKKEYCEENKIELIIIPYNDETLLKSNELAQRLRGQVPE